MSQYLKRIEISNVGNVEEEIQSHYLKRVHVVEVVDSDGNPWEPATEIGTVTINPETTAVAAMDSATFSVVVTGGDATDLTYKWSVRGGGNAILDSPDDQTSATFIFVRSGQETIQCSVSSDSASNSPQSNTSFVVVS